MEVKHKTIIFGGCIPKGMCSHFEIVEGEIKAVTKLKYINQEEYSVYTELTKEGVDIELVCGSFWGLSYSGTGYPSIGRNINPKLSILYNFMERDLSEYDNIIIFFNTNDMRKNTAITGYEDDLNPYTFYGALNMLFKEIKEKYSNKNFIFILPPYYDGVSYLWDFEEYNNVLKRKILKEGYDFISFYDDYKMIFKDKIDYLFPDGIHPSFDCRYIMVPYYVDKIKKLIK